MTPKEYVDFMAEEAKKLWKRWIYNMMIIFKLQNQDIWK